MDKYKESIKYAERWLSIIRKEELDEATSKEVSRETVDNFVNHFNKGWVEYRKSVVGKHSMFPLEMPRRWRSSLKSVLPLALKLPLLLQNRSRPKVREICDRFEILLIADEVQTGMGRTGKLWGLDHWNVVPNILCVAKSLGGGLMSVGAFMGNGKIWSVFEDPNPFIHTLTTGGNPMACAAAIAAINVTLRDDLSAKAETNGNYFMSKLHGFVEKYPQI